MTTVSVIVPCRNEVRHIDDFLRSAFAQELAEGDVLAEVIVADGASDDGTQDRLRDWALREPRLCVVDNERRITSAALNLAINRAIGDIVVRMDVHTTYAPDYISQCLRVLEETGATCVGGAWHSSGAPGIQRAIARAFQSRFGSGGAASRNSDYSGPVDTVYLGAWRRKDLLHLGGFDETLVRNQDDELNLRIVRSGGQVWQSPRIRSSYTPRKSLGALFRQFYQYGYWKVPVIRKHRLPASPRHLVPVTFFAVIIVLLVITPLAPIAGKLLSVLLLVYAAAALVIASRLGKAGEVPAIMLAFFCMHFGYGLGFAHGFFDFVLQNRGPRDVSTRLTR